MGDELIEIGKIKAPKGLKGKMWIIPSGESTNLLKHYSNLIVNRRGLPRKIVSCLITNRGCVLELEGITDISHVEMLKGESLYVKREWMPSLDEDEYYWSDLIGLDVVDPDGRNLGKIVNIFSTGSNDVYVVDEKKQYLIPATKDIVLEISIDKGTVLVDSSLLAGLVD